MPCPACGGSSRRAIAPGYWECTSVVQRTVTTIEPVAGAPPHLGIVGPTPHPVQERCGRRYHEATGGNEVDVQASCACGIFAIGRCAVCDQPVCGEHGRLHDGRLTCLTDIESRRRAAAAEASRAQTEAEQRADQKKIDDAVSTVARGADAIERCLLACTLDLRVNDDYFRRGFTSRKARRLAVEKIGEVIGGAPGAEDVRVGTGDEPAWTIRPGAVEPWLRARRKPDTKLTVGLLGSVVGWRIGGGVSSSGHYTQPDWHYDVVLGVDELVYKVARGSRKLTKWQARAAGKFESHVAATLAIYLGLAPEP